MLITHDARYPSRRSPVLARNVVSTSQPLATQAGLRMLQAGGNALDAALAAAIALVVVEPTGNGLGSDAFCILWDGTSLHGLNASGRSPEAWDVQRFKGAGAMPLRGWESVTVPGAVSAWADLSARFGRLDFEALFEPAIDYAARGYHVSPVIAELWSRGAQELAIQPGFAAAFMPDGRAPHAGQVFRFPALAESLRLVAQTRGRALYEGVLADRIAAFAREHGAALTLADLGAHRNDWCGTISEEFAGADIHEIPPNGQGLAALMALGILKRTRFADCAPDSVDALHLQIEAMKLALADAAAYVGDSAAMVSVTADDLLDSDYLALRARAIDARRAQVFGAGAPRRGGTVYLCTADANGMMVSYIQSNYAGFGSGVVVPDTGISMQNRGTGFSLQPGHPNCVGPAKRPFHTIIPAFAMRDGQPLMAFGVMGGPMQAQGHVQMASRILSWGQDPQAAADAPRWRFIEGLDVALEAAVPHEVAQALAELGHRVRIEAPDTSFAFGGAQIIARIEAGYIAGSDPRKDGCAAGF